MSIENVIGILAGIMTGIAALPQLIKLIKEKDGTQLSPVMLLVLIGGLVSWLIYGIMKEDWPIIITNAFSALVNTIIIILRQIYKRKKT
jgi:MtN3 and saliva related transmembrane protein